MSLRPDGPLKITGGFWLMAAWFTLENGWRPLVLILSAALAHELGHVAALRLWGAPVRALRIGPLGAMMEAGRGALGYGQELTALLAGVAVNFLCATALCLPAHRFPSLYAAAGAHLVLGTFNLLPIRPLDGGQALEAGASWLFGPAAGEEIARVVGLLSAAALGIALFWLMNRTGGNLWLAPPAVGCIAVVLREARRRR